MRLYLNNSQVVLQSERDYIILNVITDIKVAIHLLTNLVFAALGVFILFWLVKIGSLDSVKEIEERLDLDSGCDRLLLSILLDLFFLFGLCWITTNCPLNCSSDALFHDVGLGHDEFLL